MNTKSYITPKSIKGVLSEKEWEELLGLEYVLTWGYTKSEKKDWAKYKKLENKRWKSLCR